MTALAHEVRLYNDARMSRLVSLHACLLALLLLTARGAVLSAQTLDQLLVLDSAAIFADRVDQVREAAERLTAEGADVRIRTLVSYAPFGNLDQYQLELERTSPSWLGADGYRKNNLLVIIICLQGGGQTGLYYGDHWSEVLDDNWGRVQTGFMNPRFRDGDYAGGTIAGLDEITRLIQVAGRDTSETATSGAPGGSGLLLVVVAAAGALTGLFLYTRLRRGNERRAGLRQRSLMAKQAAAAGVNELIETLQMLEIKLDVVSARVATEDVAPLHSSLADARRQVDHASQRYSELSHSAADPEIPSLREAELAAIEPAFTGIVEMLRQARDTIKSLEGQVTTLLSMVDDFPVKVATVRSAIADAQRLQSELTRAGFNTAYVADLLAQAQGTLALGDDLASRKRLRQATEQVTRAAVQVRHATQAAEELPEKKRQAEAAVPALASRIRIVADRIEAGRALFDRLSLGYAETTWLSVRGNGTEAENRLRWAADILDAARTAVSIEQQEWHKALELVSTASAWLDEAEMLVQAIAELETALVAARRDAPAELTAARTDIAKAWEYIHKYDDDIRESLEDELRAAETTVDTAYDELRQDKPDYLRIFRLARDANEAADRILLQAQDERDAAVRLRSRAANTLRDAQSKVATTSRFIQVRHPFVRDAAKNRLAEAIERLRLAEAATDAEVILVLAQKAESAADEAYSLAQRDVDTGPGVAFPDAGTTGGTAHGMSIPTVMIPSGWSSGSNRPWGSRPNSNPKPAGGHRGGGGSTGWGSRGSSRSGGRGGGSTGW